MKLTASLVLTLKDSQLTITFCEAWLTTVVVAFGVVMLACPAATTPPSGPATATPICMPNKIPAGNAVRINDATGFIRAEHSLRAVRGLLAARLPVFVFSTICFLPNCDGDYRYHLVTQPL